MLTDRALTGTRAENLAAQVLVGKGFQIVCRNWRRPEGEIDIVATDGGACVFVEVRSRSGDDWGHPLETITPRKRAKIIRAARLYLDEVRPSPTAGYRFDVVGVVFEPDGELRECLHIPDAFQTDW